MVVRFVNEDLKKIQHSDKKSIYDIYLSTESSTENWTQWIAHLAALFPFIIYAYYNITLRHTRGGVKNYILQLTKKLEFEGTETQGKVTPNCLLHIPYNFFFM